MPSPFPGMNPYFEQPGVWKGFHTSFLIRLADALTPQANPRYFVNVEQSVYIDRGEDERELLGYADATVTRNLEPATSPTGGIATLEAPETGTVRYGAVKKTHRWLTVRDTATRRVVTVIELLSPSNKMGGNRGEYLRKRRRVLRSTAHLVEIDLLRGGPRMPTGGVRASDYRIVVSRRPDRPRVQVWPVGLREPIPVIPIPVRTGEQDLRLELKPLVDEVYDKGGYRFHLYGTPPDPPLLPADAEWAQQFVPPPVG
jgi:hypothetical protein